MALDYIISAIPNLTSLKYINRSIQLCCMLAFQNISLKHVEIQYHRIVFLLNGTDVRNVGIFTFVRILFYVL